MARNDVRPVVRLKSTAGTGYTYVTRKNRRNDPDRLVLRKYDPTIPSRRFPGGTMSARPAPPRWVSVGAAGSG